MKKIFLSCLIFFLSLSVLGAADRFIPPPLRVHIPFEAAWNSIHSALEKREVTIQREDRGKGYVVSVFKEYASGPLTESHIAKVGEKPKLPDGTWRRVEYQYEILVELVTDREVLVTVHANIQARKRSFLGTEEWVSIVSNGQLEEGLLTEFGMILFGESFALDRPRKGFWERDFTYLPDMSERIPKMAGPERP